MKRAVRCGEASLRPEDYVSLRGFFMSVLGPGTDTMRDSGLESRL